MCIRDRSLPDGLAVELTTKAYRSSGAILIPSDAVYFDEGNAYVYVARDGAAVRTEVTLSLIHISSCWWRTRPPCACSPAPS